MPREWRELDHFWVSRQWKIPSLWCRGISLAWFVPVCIFQPLRVPCWDAWALVASWLNLPPVEARGKSIFFHENGTFICKIYIALSKVYLLSTIRIQNASLAALFICLISCLCWVAARTQSSCLLAFLIVLIHTSTWYRSWRCLCISRADVSVFLKQRCYVGMMRRWVLRSITRWRSINHCPVS